MKKVFCNRLRFHDISDDHRAKELAIQVEFDLYNYVPCVRDDRYKNWVRVFCQFVKNCGKVSVFLVSHLFLAVFGSVVGQLCQDQ